MEMLMGKKRKPSLSLSFFTSFQMPWPSSEKFPQPSKSPRPVFFDKDVVGLGIIAAMPDQVLDCTKSPMKNIFISPMLPGPSKKRVREVDPLSESYTCVISHLGNETVRKRVYYDDQVVEVDDDDANRGQSTVFAVKRIVQEPDHEEAMWPWSGYFLSCCRLCKKELHGLDIFMYRGEEAFCSPECREARMNEDKSKKNGPE